MEVDLFYSSSLDKAFSNTLAIERKLAAHLKFHQSHPKSSSTPSSPNSPSSYKSSKWCTFHKSYFHNTIDCHVVQNPSTPKTPFVDTPESSSSVPPHFDLISLYNTMAT